MDDGSTPVLQSAMQLSGEDGQAASEEDAVANSEFVQDGCQLPCGEAELCLGDGEVNSLSAERGEGCDQAPVSQNAASPSSISGDNHEEEGAGGSTLATPSALALPSSDTPLPRAGSGRSSSQWQPPAVEKVCDLVVDMDAAEAAVSAALTGIFGAPARKTGASEGGLTSSAQRYDGPGPPPPPPPRRAMPHTTYLHHHAAAGDPFLTAQPPYGHPSTAHLFMRAQSLPHRQLGRPVNMGSHFPVVPGGPPHLGYGPGPGFANRGSVPGGLAEGAFEAAYNRWAHPDPTAHQFPPYAYTAAAASSGGVPFPQSAAGLHHNHPHHLLAQAAMSAPGNHPHPLLQPQQPRVSAGAATSKLGLSRSFNIDRLGTATAAGGSFFYHPNGNDLPDNAALAAAAAAAQGPQLLGVQGAAGLSGLAAAAGMAGLGQADGRLHANPGAVGAAQALGLAAQAAAGGRAGAVFPMLHQQPHPQEQPPSLRLLSQQLSQRFPAAESAAAAGQSAASAAQQQQQLSILAAAVAAAASQQQQQQHTVAQQQQQQEQQRQQQLAAAAAMATWRQHRFATLPGLQGLQQGLAQGSLPGLQGLQQQQQQQQAQQQQGQEGDPLAAAAAAARSAALQFSLRAQQPPGAAPGAPGAAAPAAGQPEQLLASGGAPVAGADGDGAAATSALPESALPPAGTSAEAPASPTSATANDDPERAPADGSAAGKEPNATPQAAVVAAPLPAPEPSPEATDSERRLAQAAGAMAAAFSSGGSMASACGGFGAAFSSNSSINSVGCGAFSSAGSVAGAGPVTAPESELAGVHAAAAASPPLGRSPGLQAAAAAAVAAAAAAANIDPIEHPLFGRSLSAPAGRSPADGRLLTNLFSSFNPRIGGAMGADLNAAALAQLLREDADLFGAAVGAALGGGGGAAAAGSDCAASPSMLASLFESFSRCSSVADRPASADLTGFGILTPRESVSSLPLGPSTAAAPAALDVAAPLPVATAAAGGLLAGAVAGGGMGGMAGYSHFGSGGNQGGFGASALAAPAGAALGPYAGFMEARGGMGGVEGLSLQPPAQAPPAAQQQQQGLQRSYAERFAAPPQTALASGGALGGASAVNAETLDLDPLNMFRWDPHALERAISILQITDQLDE